MNERPLHIALKWIIACVIVWLIGFGFLANLDMFLIVGILFGLMLGLAQIPIFSGKIDSAKWVSGSAVGWFLGFLLATGIAAVLPQTTSESQSNFILLWGALGGGFSTGLQIFFLRYFLPEDRSVSFAYIVSGAVGGLLSQYVLLAGSDIDSPLSSWAFSIFVVYIVSGVIYGAMTAVPFVRLLQDISAMEMVEKGQEA